VKWKVIDDSGNKVLIIDNCGVLPEYRSEQGTLYRNVIYIYIHI
jgi:hypothetical protein